MIILPYMIDTSVCPICFSKLDSIKRIHTHITYINNTANYYKKDCKYGYHIFQSFLNIETNQLDYIYLSIPPYFTTFMYMDLLNNKSKIMCFKCGIPQEIHVPGIIQPDFPSLIKLREKVSKYVLFS